jgi:hypothetical protein
MSPQTAQDDTGYEFFEVNPMLPKTPVVRRSTLFARNTETAESNATTLVMQQTQPSYAHISLTYLSIGALFKFWEQVQEYQIAYKVKLPVSTLIDVKVRNQILANNPRITEIRFHALSDLEVYNLIRKMVIPQTKLEFQIQLKRYAPFELPSSYKHTAADFKPFYNTLLAYRKSFLSVYELMADDNEDCIPDCKNKEGGLIKIFIDKIPYEYGTRLISTMTDTKFGDLHVFLKRFYAKVEEHKEQHNSYLRLCQSFGGTAWLAKKSAAKVSGMVHDSLHAIYDVAEEACDAARAREDESDGEEEPAEQPRADLEDTDFDEHLQAMQGTPHQDPLVCFTKLLKGSCAKVGCKFSHREDLVAKTREAYIRMMQERQKEQPSAQKHAVLQRPHAGKISNIALREERAIDLDQRSEELFLANMPAQFYVRSVHRDGLIQLDTGTLGVSRVLFDTGAITASYISESYVNAHRAQLEPYLQPTRGKVRLAADNHTVAVSEAALLEVTFCDTQGTAHTARILFYVLPGSNNDLVIGWPAIIAHFGKLFMDMLRLAMDEYARHQRHRGGAAHAVDDSSRGRRSRRRRHRAALLFPRRAALPGDDPSRGAAGVLLPDR